jgi:cytochrome bd ubiquinol oxidase subunit II
MDLNTLWFGLVGILLIGYAILDGFDFGVGILHLFARDEQQRRLYINAIAPVWDGNEVWLLTGGGALFAAFPAVYATVFSGFYIAMMLLLFALIFRAVAMEFRGKVDSPRWRRAWDWAFGLGSLLPALLLGVAFGNILQGVPLDRGAVWAGSFIGLLRPYPLLIGLLGLTVFTMHGALYLTMKTEGSLRQRLVRIASRLWTVVIALTILATVATFLAAPFHFAGMSESIGFWALLALTILALMAIPAYLTASRYGRAFLASCVTIAGMIGLSVLTLYPRLVPSSIDLEYSLTIYNASSSPTTLVTMLVIALIGMPLVLGYTIVIYRVFKGKVVLTPDSY